MGLVRKGVYKVGFSSRTIANNKKFLLHFCRHRELALFENNFKSRKSCGYLPPEVIIWKSLQFVLNYSGRWKWCKVWGSSLSRQGQAAMQEGVEDEWTNYVVSVDLRSS